MPFKSGFSVWHLEKVLRALHTIFHNVPARREDFCTLTKTSVFPLPFCGHRWIENLPVVKRAIEIWPMIVMYLDAVTRKKLPNPGTSSYDTLAEARKDPFVMAKFHFFMALSMTFSTFLTKYQTDEPVMPFISKDLAVLMKSFLRRFIKGQVLEGITTVQMLSLDVTDKQLRVCAKDVDIGLGAEVVLKVLWKIPNNGQCTGDMIIQQFSNFLCLEAKAECFLSFQPMQKRLDVFLHGFVSQSYPELWAFCKKLLLLSHGQATVERGFSVNKEVEMDNMQEDTVVAQRMICDYVCVNGGPLKVPLTKELLAAAASARSQYRLHLDQERRKKESNAKREKRKVAEDHVEQLKKKKTTLLQVANSLEQDVGKMAEQAEGKSGSLMAQLITKSNILKKRCKEKLTEVKEVEAELEKKSTELRHMPECLLPSNPSC